MANLDRDNTASKLISDCYQESGISIEDLSGGSRLRQVSRVRRGPASRLTAELGLSLAGTARLSGGPNSGVSNILVRKGLCKSN